MDEYLGFPHSLDPGLWRKPQGGTNKGSCLSTTENTHKDVELPRTLDKEDAGSTMEAPEGGLGSARSSIK